MKNCGIVLLVVLFVLCLLASCRQVRYVPVVTYKTDSVYLQQVKRDSIYQRDSIYVREKGDTVTVYRDRYLFVDKLVRDTLYVNRTDSVRVPYPVEKSLTRWQEMKMELGGWAFGVIIVAALVIVGWLVYRMRRK